ncbi:unnamed product [Ostreococcus tauri]|uniref:Unnamed product n=1 Tax=Ostreococcus tauri TaxID=70448 RepID=A0A096PA35_OSTTA|nr:unnamed product [Ostreococcus tauri]CEG01798.1 unnamed product [Ostreococcus tauri]|eukprot:XP_022841175.1 unnamed product [Ostreococcus tauri]
MPASGARDSTSEPTEATLASIERAYERQRAAVEASTEKLQKTLKRVRDAERRALELEILERTTTLELRERMGEIARARAAIARAEAETATRARDDARASDARVAETEATTDARRERELERMRRIDDLERGFERERERVERHRSSVDAYEAAPDARE